MKLNLVIDESDVEEIKKLYQKHRLDSFIQERIKGLHSPVERTKENIWKQMIMCLITSQQRSGKDSKVSKFINLDPFPLNYSNCVSKNDLKEFVSEIISNHGLRFKDRISSNVSYNLKILEEGKWNTLLTLLNEVSLVKDASRKIAERQASRQISKMFKGFGPKQSRHLLLGLRLTHYEIPIDSRILRWLNDQIGVNIIPSQGLSDEIFFCFILDRIQELSDKADLSPAIVDALLFINADSQRKIGKYS